MKHGVVASLEGARVVITNEICELSEYDFQLNSWALKERHAWPLSNGQAHEWLHGWNKVDRFKAFNLLVRPEPD